MAQQTLVDKAVEFLKTDAELFRAAIAEAAYYKAERRGFLPGYELADWLAAESQVFQQMSRAGADLSPTIAM